MVVLFHKAWKESNNLLKTITFGKQSSPDPTIGYDSDHEGVDPDSSCRLSTSEPWPDLEQDSDTQSQPKLAKLKKLPTPQGAYQNQVQRFYTTGNFLKTTPFKTHMRPSEFGRLKLKSDKLMLEQMEKLLAYQ